ncbi:MAG: hypothetical protein K8W52_22795 [Deltaproteobacteria bacterium]|nr:hypothetical protein [Deltaproteobacteria bacterium]
MRDIVKAFAEGDYDLARGIPRVTQPSKATADHARAYVEDYGETLAELPEETWRSSVSQWMGNHWEVLVDLWTLESGRSDLVLHLLVREDADGFRFEIHLLYVP